MTVQQEGLVLSAAWMPQGYPLYAAVAGEADDGELVLGFVVGWCGQTEAEAWPVVAVPGGMAYVMRPSRLRYLGPDRGRAMAACSPEGASGALSATQTAGHASPARRYAPGAVALCGLLNAHEPHTWVPEGHDFPISCTGGTP